MKYLKQYQEINEEFNFKFIDKLKIKYLCRKYNIKNYTINEDGSIDVNGDVSINYKGITKLPLKFRNVSGHFTCHNNGLTTLDGCPKSVGGIFNCRDNKLTTLDGCPESIGGNFICFNNRIRTLEGFPRNIGGGTLISNNPVYVLWVLFLQENKVELFNDFGITDGNVVIIDRLNEFLDMIGKTIITRTGKDKCYMNLNGDLYSKYKSPVPSWKVVELIESEGYKII